MLRQDRNTLIERFGTGLEELDGGINALIGIVIAALTVDDAAKLIVAGLKEYAASTRDAILKADTAMLGVVSALRFIFS